MEKYSKKAESFINNYVLLKLVYAQTKEADEKIDEEMLELASSVVTEITSRTDW